jgi:hypothetical protein
MAQEEDNTKVTYERVCLTITTEQREELKKYPFLNVSGLYQNFLSILLPKMDQIIQESKEEVERQIAAQYPNGLEEDQNP